MSDPTVEPRVHRESPLSVVLAAFGVCAVLGLAGTVLLRPEESHLSAQALRMEEQLAAHAPDVVVLGASLASASIDPQLLARATGQPTPQVQLLAVNSSRPATWYAVLKNRVFGNGYRPKVILVVDLLDRTFVTELPHEQAREDLRGQMGADEPVIRTKSFGERAGSATVQRVRANASSVRTSTLDFLKFLPIGLIYGDGDGSVMERGERVATPALDEVFAADNVRPDDNVRVIPVVEKAKVTAQDAPVDVRASYLPDLAALATEYDAKLVVVRSALSPSNTTLDRPGPAFEREAISLFNELGVGWIDLRQLPVTESDFRDQAHMTASGRAKASREIGERLATWDVLGDGALPPAMLPLVPTRVSREGTPPPLPELGEPTRVAGTDCTWRLGLPSQLDVLSDPVLASAKIGGTSPLVLTQDGEPLEGHVLKGSDAPGCTGQFQHARGGLLLTPRVDAPEQLSDHSFAIALSDELPLTGWRGTPAWWVYPGTTVRLDYAQPPDGEESMTVEWIAQRAGPGKGVPTLAVNGKSVPVVASGSLLRAILEIPRPDGPWDIQLHSPADGPYVQIRTIAVGKIGAQNFLIGSPARRGEDATRIIGSHLGGGTFTYAAAPPALTTRPAEAPEGQSRLVVDSKAYIPTLSELRDARSSLGNALHVYEDGELLGGAFGPCDQLGTKPASAKGALVTSCFPGGLGATFLGSDGSDPLKNGRSYTLGLDPDRACVLGKWLYPGDALRVEFRDTGTPVGADTLEILAIPLPKGALGSIHLRLVADEQVVLDQVVPLSELSMSEPKSWPLSARIGQNARVVFEASTQANGPWVSLAVVALVTRAPFENKPNATAKPQGEPIALLGVPGARRQYLNPPPTPAAILPVWRSGSWTLPIPRPLQMVDPVTGEPCPLFHVLDNGEEVESATNQGAMVAFTVKDGTNPRTNGRTYALSVDAERSCGAGLALLPRDGARVVPPKGQQGAGGLYDLRIAALSEGATKGVNFVVRDGNGIAFKGVLTPDQLRGEAQVFRVDLSKLAHMWSLAVGLRGDPRSSVVIQELTLVPVENADAATAAP